MKAYITHMAYYLPNKIEESEKGRLQKKTGILRRHICPDGMTASDMAVEAAEELFAQGIKREEMDFLLFCTQSPDYYLPSTACILQDRLSLPSSSGALDFDLGCSGFVYGLGMAKGLVESGQAKHVLLITSESYSKYIHPEDYALRPLFGDAATATLVSAVDAEKEGIHAMVYGTDGRGAKELIVPVGGMRHRCQETEILEETDKYGNIRTNQHLYMNGGAIMDFALDVVPKTVEEILARTSLTRKEVDYFVFHQANNFMLKYLQDTCSLLGLPYWNDVREYGNTVSNSIPIAVVDMVNMNRDKNLENVMLVGFGVGLSWGGCMVDLNYFRNSM